MAIRIVRLGDPRLPSEGLRVGTVRRPPRGIPKSEFAARDFYDVWLPELAPSETLLKIGQASTTSKAWTNFSNKYRAEMKKPEADRLLTLFAALSKTSDFSVGCYCGDESRCHRSVLRALLKDCLLYTSPSPRD